MAKEVDLKKIELKVSANCCEGCRRKVKKALRNTEGVLKTDIDLLQPKVIVLGNVNPHILIKKLLKVGKHAELSSYEEVVKAENKAETIAVKEKEKQDRGFKQEKKLDGCDNKIEKKKDVIEGGDGGMSKGSKEDIRKSNMTANASNPQEMRKEYPNLPHPEGSFTVHPRMHLHSNIKTHPQFCYIAQPYAVAVPYYAMPSYPAPPLPPACVEDYYYHFDKPRFEPLFSRPAVRVGDYFSDENTMACHVM